MKIGRFWLVTSFFVVFMYTIRYVLYSIGKILLYIGTSDVICLDKYELCTLA